LQHTDVSSNLFGKMYDDDLTFFFSVLYDEVYSNTTMTSFISIQCLERSK